MALTQTDFEGYALRHTSHCTIIDSHSHHFDDQKLEWVPVYQNIERSKQTSVGASPPSSIPPPNQYQSTGRTHHDSEVPAVPVGDKPLVPGDKNFDPKYFQDISASQRAAAQAAAESRARSKAKEREVVGKKIEQKRKAEEQKAVEAEKKKRKKALKWAKDEKV